MHDGYYTGNEKDVNTPQEEKNRRKIKENQKQKRKPTERTLARLEGKKKEEIIKRTWHRTDLQTKEPAAQATQEKFESQLSENHLE